MRSSDTQGIRRARAGTWLIAAVVLGGSVGIGAAGLRPAAARRQLIPVPAALTSTPRPRLPPTSSPLWLVPDQAAMASVPRAAASFASAVRLFTAAKYADALPVFASPALAGTPLADYAAFYAGLCSLKLSRPADARAAFAKVHARRPAGYVLEAAIRREAEAASALGDYLAAAVLSQELLSMKPADPDTVLLALGQARKARGDRAGAAQAFSQIHYEMPTSDVAVSAAAELATLDDTRPARHSAARIALELARAERLFAAKRYQPARQALEPLAPLASGDNAELAAVRLAECDYFLKRYRQARDRLAPLLATASRREEVRFFHLRAMREVGSHAEFVRLTRSLIADAPTSPWAEEALNNLATHYVLIDDDEQADAAFRELYAAYPKGGYAERAAWRAGWRAYRNDRHQDTVGYFEGAASTFPRTDYRPSYLYWSARAREALGDAAGASTVYRIVTTDYLSTYYGRLASGRLQKLGVKTAPGATAPERAAPSATAEPPTAELIRLLLTLGLHEQARDELLFAQRTYGDTPLVGATLGWVYNRLGDYRRGIVAMRRAYPQYMSEEGRRLPADVLKVIFPLDHWALINKYATARGLDPYFMAALINQESAFDARIRSSAGAIGLMQVMPSTGRLYARKLGLKRYGTASLTRPETNIQIGMAYFADILQRSGDLPRALAGYNAGESRVARWNAERPGVEIEEYIDDIPFPETQSYVRRILGTAEDYRRLYGEGAAGARPQKPRAPARTGR